MQNAQKESIMYTVKSAPSINSGSIEVATYKQNIILFHLYYNITIIICLYMLITTC